MSAPPDASMLQHKTGVCRVVLALFVLSCICALMIESSIGIFSRRYPLSQGSRNAENNLVSQRMWTKVDEHELKVRRVCKQFGLSQHKGQKRKMFYGTLIADEPKIVFELVAAELGGVVDYIIMIEPNITQSGTPRKLRFVDSNPEKAWVRELFESRGMKVEFGNYLEGPFDKKRPPLARENQGRLLFYDYWKKNKMKGHDIGIVADLDELFTHDFHIAIKSCSVYSEFDDVTGVLEGEDLKLCKNAKIVANALRMESAFNCVQMKRWWHPDAMIGHCLYDIDGSQLLDKYTYFDRPKYLTGEKARDALWSAYDYRMRSGAKRINKAVDHGGRTITAFHFHNFWTAKEEKLFRLKYSTYAHARKGAMTKALETFDGDVGMGVRCKRDEYNPKDIDYRFLGIWPLKKKDPLQFPIPVLLQEAMQENSKWQKMRTFFAPASLTSLPAVSSRT